MITVLVVPLQLRHHEVSTPSSIDFKHRALQRCCEGDKRWDEVSTSLQGFLVQDIEEFTKNELKNHVFHWKFHFFLCFHLICFSFFTFDFSFSFTFFSFMASAIESESRLCTRCSISSIHSLWACIFYCSRLSRFGTHSRETVFEVT